MQLPQRQSFQSRRAQLPQQPQANRGGLLNQIAQQYNRSQAPTRGGTPLLNRLRGQLPTSPPRVKRHPIPQSRGKKGDSAKDVMGLFKLLQAELEQRGSGGVGSTK